LPDELVLVGDLELGAGVGLGGRVAGDVSMATVWTTRQAYGLYEGLGVGLRWRWLGGYLRGRIDASGNTSAPPSLWPTLMAGLEARAGRDVVFGVGGGLGGVWAEGQGWVGFWFYQAHFALLFDLAPKP